MRAYVDRKWPISREKSLKIDRPEKYRGRDLVWELHALSDELP